MTKSAVATLLRKVRPRAQRSPGWRRLVAKLTLVASLLVGTLMVTPGTAHAADYWTCGHRVVTTYDQGWIRISGMTGVAGRPDIRAVGWMSFGGGFGFADFSVQSAINTGTRWASFNLARITIDGHPECTVFIR